MIALHPSEELLFELSDEPRCPRCHDWHDLSPVAAARCRRIAVVAFAAKDTCRQVSERQRTIAQQRARAAR